MVSVLLTVGPSHCQVPAVRKALTTATRCWAPGQRRLALEKPQWKANCAGLCATLLLAESAFIIRGLAKGSGFEVRKMAMRTQKRKWWLFSRILLCILLGISLATVVITGRFWWQQQANGPTGSAATPEALKEKLEFYDKRADELEKLLTLLLGVSTIYAIALGLSAYQQMKDSADSLKNLRKEAEKEIDEFVVKVESKFPLFADMDLRIREIMDRLMLLLPVIDWSDEDYRNLTEPLKQEILFYEKTVASLECFDLRGTRHIRQTVSEIYHGLGNFYGLRYASGSRQSKNAADKLASASFDFRFFIMLFGDSNLRCPRIGAALSRPRVADPRSATRVPWARPN